MKNKPLIPIFYACDDAFAKYCAVSIKSLITNSSKDYNYKIYILHTTISDNMKIHFDSLSTEQHLIEFFDVSEFLDKIKNELPIRHYYSKTTYYRLFIAEQFTQYDKAIYLDSDTIVEGDISEMYNYDVSNYYLGACHEQVMIQVDVYGTYVEEVLGISRHNFFNAGILLINCKAFREQKVLEQFITLLHEYNFIVTQDEDYLNFICHNKVLWLPQEWNTELAVPDLPSFDTVRIFHYIMVSKPWQYKDCVASEYFWKYAKLTTCYDLIIESLNNYSDADKKSDIETSNSLYQMAINEINREDNFLKRRKALANKN